MDVTIQVQGIYSCQVQNHKQYHKMFYIMLDIELVNSCIVHIKKHTCNQGLMKFVESHLRFQIETVKALPYTKCCI